MSKIELHYSIKDGGDGSAYPVWFETKELAEWHQDNLDIGWGESCTGKIVVEGDNLKCIQLQTAVSHFAEMLGDYHFELEKAIDFVWIFLPDTQMDDWSVSCDPSNSKYLDVMYKGKCVAKHFSTDVKKSATELLNKIESAIEGNK